VIISIYRRSGCASNEWCGYEYSGCGRFVFSYNRAILANVNFFEKKLLLNIITMFCTAPGIK
jgi:hypothetical protein